MAVRNDTVSLERVRKVWTKSVEGPKVYAEFTEFPTADLPRFYVHSAPYRLKYVRDRCFEFLSCTEQPSENFRTLDELYSQHFTSNMDTVLSVPRPGAEATPERAYDVLQRLPKCSTELPDFEGMSKDLAVSLNNDEQETVSPPQFRWEEWELSRAMSRNVILITFLALSQRIRGDGGMVNPDVWKLITMTSELLEISSIISAEPEQKPMLLRWLSVRTFLWTSWQRLVFIYFHQMQSLQISRGFQVDFDERDYILRRTLPAPGIPLSDVIRKMAKRGKSDYMCSWALELVHSTEVAVAADLSVFHARFNARFGELPARCNPGSDGANGPVCDGTRPDRCQRFANMQGVEDQSAHDETCTGLDTCGKLAWNKASYLECDRPRGIMLAPEDEEPGEIRDLMSIDMTKANFDEPEINEDTVQACEQVIATLLVCDWNVRAWTFLECVKARENLRLLCSHNCVVRFIDIARIVHDCGHIDLSILALSASHLYPSRTTAGIGPNPHRAFKPGETITKIHRAAAQLSYRPAREERDETRIWSLLIRNTEPFADPVKLWHSQRDTWIPTGFLMSSSPRLDAPGLSWAPRTPNAARQQWGEDRRFYRAYDGEETRAAFVMEEGLRGVWRCFKFPLKGKKSLRWQSISLGYERLRFEQKVPSDFVAECNKVQTQLLGEGGYGLLMQPDISDAPNTASPDISRAMRPALPHLHSIDYPSVEYRGSTHGSLMAVCESQGLSAVAIPRHEDEYPLSFPEPVEWPKWTWKGLYEWPEDVILPGLDAAEILIG
ncbi:MAG: hypothetical protein Q9162_005264 [Coniocarpon cinnabarinum]